MKLLLIVVFLSALACLPQEEGKSVGAEQQRLKKKPCTVQFERKMSFETVAATAGRIKSICELSKSEVLELAKSTFN